MVYEEVVSIEYKAEYGDSEVYTKFSYASGTIDRRRFYNEILYNRDCGDRIVERLKNGETIRLVSDNGAGCYCREVYYLISTTKTNDLDLHKWIEEIKAEYDSIACESDTTLPNDLYHKKWPGCESLGVPTGFEEAEKIDCLEEEEDDGDDDSDIWS